MAGGRPSKYKVENCEQARKMCLLGATDKDLAAFFEVHLDTIMEWKDAHPEFSEALKKGKELADATVSERLYKRATGYEAPDLDIKMYEGEIIQTPYIKHYPPDTVACIFWLKNRQPKLWRDKVETKVETDTDLMAILPHLPDALRTQLIQFIEGLRAKQDTEGAESTGS